MADQKISQLTAAATPLVGTEVFPIVQSGSTVKATIANVQAAPIAAETASRMLYLNASKVPTTSANATFDGTNLGLGASPTFYSGRLAVGGHVAVSAGNSLKLWNTGGTGLATLAGTGTNELSITAADGVKLVDGNLIQGTAAKGINFTANTNAPGMTSELLNWYEEGTWTPVGNGITLSSASGTYIRVGSLVTVFFEIVFPATADTSLAQVSGLPFSASTNFRNGAAIGFTTDTAGNKLLAYNSLVQIYNTSGSQTTNASNSTKQYYGSLSYRV